MYLMRGKPTLVKDESLQFLRQVREYGPDLQVVDGLRVRAPESTRAYTSTGAVQPLSGRELMLLPEGEREEGQLTFWAWKDQPDTPLAGDVCLRDGRYLVMVAMDWGRYVRCRLVRDDTGNLEDV